MINNFGAIWRVRTPKRVYGLFERKRQVAAGVVRRALPGRAVRILVHVTPLLCACMVRGIRLWNTTERMRSVSVTDSALVEEKNR